MPRPSRVANIIVGMAVTALFVALAFLWLHSKMPDLDVRCRDAGYDHAAGLAGGDDFCVDSHGAVFERKRPTN